MGPRFQDRFDGGRFLAKKLRRYADDPATLVLALPRGGVPVGYEVARSLNAPLDIFVVRKLGVPGYEELAMGAVASGGVTVLNDDIVQRLGIPGDVIQGVARDEQAEVNRREAAYRGNREPAQIIGKNIILVDDGLATGASMRAAVRALRQKNPNSICVAVPIGSVETCDNLRSEADEVLCAETPEPFFAVGTWYSNFLQTTDDEVRELLDRVAQERKVGRVAKEKQRAFSE